MRLGAGVRSFSQSGTDPWRSPVPRARHAGHQPAGAVPVSFGPAGSLSVGAKDCMVAPKESLPVNTLGPDDLRMAADPFEAALRALDEATCPYDPHTVRLIIGRY